MAKSKYDSYTKEQLIEKVRLLEKYRYGIVWEEKPEEIADQCERELPVLVEDKTKEIVSETTKPTHFIFEGDNYHTLYTLNFTHKRKIDVIYIDPPYNTGAKDWKYNNNYVDINDPYRHSKWLSFMNKRLRLAKYLLKPDGILIIAIDDNELSTLSLLLDRIFPSKVKNTVVIVNNPHGVVRSGFSRCHEYALFLLNPGQTVNKKKVAEDKRTINLRRSGNNSLRADSPTMFYPIYIDKKTFEIVKVGNVPDKEFHPEKQTIEFPETYEIWPLDNKGIEKNWYYSKKRVTDHGNEELTCKKVKGQVHTFFQHSNNSLQTYKSIWTSNEYDAGAYGTTLVKNLTNSNFPFPKSINTVIDCLRAVLKNKNAIILDFFAGSGTTGHAVLELNREDNGNRQFILCTNNENNICEEITYPRIKKVIEGYAGSKSIKANVKYFKTDFVPSVLTDNDKRILVSRSTELLCITENTFEVVKLNNKKLDFAMYKNAKQYSAIIYDENSIEDCCIELNKINPKYKVIIYVFSYDHTYDEIDFITLTIKFDVKPIPEAILNVYRKISKLRRK